MNSVEFHYSIASSHFQEEFLAFYDGSSNFMKNMWEIQNFLDNWYGWCYNQWKLNSNLNRWSGDNGDYAFTESLRCWESGKKQFVKWTAEGAGKQGIPRICPEYSATWRHTSIAGDMMVSRQAHGSLPWIKVAPRIFYKAIFVLDRRSSIFLLSRTFYFSNQKGEMQPWSKKPLSKS